MSAHAPTFEVDGFQCPACEPGIWQPLKVHTAQARVIEAARAVQIKQLADIFDPRTIELDNALEALDRLGFGSSAT